jgi:hypothetical protein
MNDKAYEKLKIRIAKLENNCPPGVPQQVWDEEVAQQREWQKQYVKAVVTHVEEYEASEGEKKKGSAALKAVKVGRDHAMTTTKTKTTKARADRSEKTGVRSGQTMKTLWVLSIRQPWAGLIAAGVKKIENRKWRTDYRGPVLIHAGLKIARGFKLLTKEELERRHEDPDMVALLRLKGGIIGIADLTDCVTKSKDKWFKGPYGFVFRNARTLNFIPSKGQLRLYHPDPELLRTLPKSVIQQ